MSYYQILQAEIEQRKIRLWRPVARIYELAGGEVVLVISLLLGVGSLYFGWRNYKIKNTSSKQDEYADKPTYKDIMVLEKQIGFLLPSDYRKYLLHYNGGTPIACKLNEYIQINYFYQLVTDNPRFRLSEIFETVPNYGYGLPIGKTIVGDLLVLSPEGAVLLFDVEEFTDDDGEFDDIEGEPEYIAESFTALLEGLY
ncbi:hypothetical protein BKK47_10725 [Rodentibacter mrazii]|uniref:Knr4/Smi1-like domain-containing protein n=2 Tax=Rodentibacter mrazii TaxID=1908257 RepID=A0A1V3ICC2_9PAST|nr:hypothetical protein BKK47_10725 [Rodentibacter mrazii]